MPALKVPEEYRPALETLRKLSSEQVDELLGALRRAPLKFYRDDLASSVKESVHSIEGSDVSVLVDLWPH